MKDITSQIIDKWVTGYKTSWKYMKRKGFPEAEEYGDCIFIKVFEQDAIKELKELMVKEYERARAETLQQVEEKVNTILKELDTKVRCEEPETDMIMVWFENLKEKLAGMKGK